MKTETVEESCQRWERLLVEVTSDPPKKFDLVQLWALSAEQPSKVSQQQITEVKETEEALKGKEIQTDLLRAVGNCRTIEELTLRDASFGRYGAGLNILSPIEWELFFSKLQSNPVLRSVVLEGSSVFLNAVIPPFTAFLASSTTLEMLRIGELLHEIKTITKSRIRRLEEETVQKLAGGLVHSKTLRFLQISSVEVTSIHILLKAFTAYPRNQSLQIFEIDEYVGWLGYALPSLLVAEHTTLKEIRLNILTCTELDVEQCNAVGCALQQATSLETFTLISDLRPTFDSDTIYNVQNVMDVMDEMVRSSRESPLLKFDVCILRDYLDVHLSTWLVKALSRYSSIDRLQLSSRRAGGFEIHELIPLFEALKTNIFLQSLTIKNIAGAGGWKELTECLHSNTTLRKLSYEDNKDLDDDSFKSLMELLQVNIYLEDIDFGSARWSSDGRIALVKEALTRNKAMRAHLETLGNAGFALTGPKAGRLFLCGSPHSGKTRLRMTMMKTRTKKSWLRKVVSGSVKKTKGVEIEMLKDDDVMQLSVWDLAGQWIFRALQDLIFPRASQTCVFLFVFSPLDDNTDKVKTDLGQALRAELTSWLRFIASNSQVTGHNPPHVLVVITHRDKMDNQESGWAKFIVNDLQEKFYGLLKIHGGDELFYVDAQLTKEVQPLTDYVVRIFEKSLGQRGPLIPLACSHLSSKLAKRPVEVINCPVWHIDTLYSFFAQEIKHMNAGIFDLRNKPDRKILEVMALYMHDSGSIVIIPDSEMVVVDVNWLTDKFLGRLICQGYASIKDGSAHLSPDGFVPDFELQETLLKLWTKHRRQGITFDIRILEELLLKLDLCYHVVGKKEGGRFFIPSLFGKDETKQMQRTTLMSQCVLDWTSSDANEWDHFGFRLQCKDKERTLLTPAVFPRFQTHLRNKMKALGLDVIPENFDCVHDFTRIHINGYYIIVERGGHAGDHVDILVRFSKQKHRERAAAMVFTKKNLVEEFKAYCASPKGCPGVALVVAIMRPDCVRKLTPQLHRVSNQVVLVEDLKKEFAEDVERKLQTVEMDGQQWGEGNFLFDYQHAWPRVPHPQAGLSIHSELAIELLERRDVEDVVKAVRKRREACLQELQTVMDEMDITIGSGDSTKSDKEKLGVAAVPVTPSTLSLATNLVKEADSVPEHDDEDVSDSENEVLSLNERDAQLVNIIVTQVDKRAENDGEYTPQEQQEHHIRKDLARVISIQRELRANLIHVMSKVDRMICYTDTLKKAKMPRRPYLTLDDMGFGKRLGGAVQFGTPVRLHLMCENQSGPHIIDKQPGWGVCVTKDNKEWLRLISVNSLRIAWYLMKSGVQLVLPPSGPGSAPSKDPELSELGIGTKGALTVTDVTVESLKSRESLTISPGDEMTSEAWTFLKNCMAAKLNYAHDFRLHLVKYRATAGAVSETHAWLCQSCITRGQRNGILSTVEQNDN